MDKVRGFGIALAMLSVALAGCAGGEEEPGQPFAAQIAEDPVAGVSVFKAQVSGDAYRWDFGNGQTAEGEEVEHVFGYTDGRINVRLLVTDGGEEQSYSREFELGSGRNGAPQFQMAASTNWIIPGEPVRITMTDSSDPDGDPLFYEWFCVRAGDLTPIPPDHPSHGLGGVPFGVNFVASLANETLPEPDRVVEGDLCETLGDRPTGAFTQDTTIEGTFNEMGNYWIRVVAKDPKSPQFIGEHTMFVADWKAPEEETMTFSHDLQGGYGGNFQSLLADSTDQDFDQYEHTFTVPIDIAEGSAFTFDYSTPAQVEEQGVPKVSLDLKPNVNPTVATPGTYPLDAGRLKAGQEYTVSVKVEPGIQVNYSVVLDLIYDVSPFRIWEEPTR